jgi:hypothetical protein
MVTNGEDSMLHATSPAGCIQGVPVFSLAPLLVLCYPILTFQFGSDYLAGGARR